LRTGTAIGFRASREHELHFFVYIGGQKWFKIQRINAYNFEVKGLTP